MRPGGFGTSTKLVTISLVFKWDLVDQVWVGPAIWCQMSPLMKVIPYGTVLFQSRTSPVYTEWICILVDLIPKGSECPIPCKRNLRFLFKYFRSSWWIFPVLYSHIKEEHLLNILAVGQIWLYPMFQPLLLVCSASSKFKSAVNVHKFLSNVKSFILIYWQIMKLNLFKLGEFYTLTWGRHVKGDVLPFSQFSHVNIINFYWL